MSGLAARAARGEFNDYFSEHPSPKTVLVEALHMRGAPSELIERVVRGEFDSGREEAQEWRRSVEAQEIVEMLEAM